MKSIHFILILSFFGASLSAQTTFNLELQQTPSGTAIPNYPVWLKIIPDTGSAYSISGQTNASGWFQFTDSSATATGVQVVSISYDCNGATITDTTALVNLGDTLLIPCAQASANICNADFNLSTTSGLKINLKDTSVAWNINAANYTFTWNFGDGTVDTTSTLGDTLIHNYLQAGAYNVCLSLLIYDPFTQIVVCQSTVCQNISVGGGSASCQAGFNVVGMGSTQYNFSNNSTATNLPPISTVSYLWTFGDGDTATTTNAMHSYAQPGNYTVCLYQTVRDSSNQVSCTSDTCLIINVPPQVTCQAEFTFVKDSSASRTINFLEQSNLGNLPPGAQVTQFWNFGDGASDTGTAVTHHYSNAGNYIACLSIIVLDSLNGDTLCQSTLCKAINISPVPVFCQVQYIVDTANSYFGSVYIWNTSNPVQSDSSYTNSYTWDFGDGNKSNQAFPVHAFNNPGLYQVCLSILSINQVGDTCMSTYCDSLGADSLGNLIYKNSQTAFKLTVLNPENISLRENELKKTRLFPNPATNQVRVVLPTQLAKVEWQLLDLKGSVVKYGSTRNCQLLNLDVALLPPGIYLLSLNSEALTPVYHKLLIEN